MKKMNEKKTENTIFIQIASYRDPQLSLTLEDCIKNAKYPENLRFGIAWQHCDEDLWDNLDIYKNDSRFKILNINYKDSQGVCWARNLVQSLYSGEKYTLQLDSHHRFAKDWDETLIDMLVDLQKDGYPKPLITAYIPSFDPDNDPEKRVREPWKMTFDRYIPEGAVFFLPAGFDPNKDDLTKPMMARFYSAHFAFSIGDFAQEVKHDPYYYFHGEEINVAVRAFTHGYDLFYPHKVICWHEYTRKGRSKHWDDDKEWGTRNTYCHLRNRKLFEMDGELNDIDFGIYGFGNIRSLKDYEKYAGMKFSQRAITQDVVDHNLPRLENIKMTDEEFENSLLYLFKHCIDVGYDQVPEEDYDFWAVAFKDKDGKDMYRKDADSDEIKRMKKDPDGYCKVWRSFETKEKPSSWIVWPHSKTKGWSDPITGNI
jgi:glycosyltransferase involved in cell wall biosynthesis